MILKNQERQRRAAQIAQLQQKLRLLKHKNQQAQQEEEIGMQYLLEKTKQIIAIKKIIPRNYQIEKEEVKS